MELTVFGLLLSLFPRAFVLVVGITFAVVRLRRHPLVSVFVTSGCSVALVLSALSAVLPMAMTSGGVSTTGIGLVMGALGLVGDIGLCLLLAAAFVERRPPEPARLA